MSDLEFRAGFPRAARVIEAALGPIPGAVAGVEWGEGGLIHRRIGAFGQRRVVPSALPMLVDTLFDLASLTKVMGTTALAARLIDRGWLGWDTPLRALLPAAAGSSHILIRHLLSHTAGYVAWEPFWQKLRDRFGGRDLWTVPVADRQRAMRELVTAVAPGAAPGETCLYSDVSFLLLGFALEDLLGQPLDRAVTREVFAPLGLPGLRYARVDRDAAAGRDDAVAATEDCPWRGGVLQGQVHDDNCWSMGGYAGHAGAFGRAADVLDFARAVQGSFLSRATREAMWARVPGFSRTLGWDTPSGPESSAGHGFSAGTVGHLGFTGTSLWIDRAAGVTMTLLTNRVHPSREAAAAVIKRLRPAFHDAAWADLRSGGPS